MTSDINHGAAADWEFLGRPWRDPRAFVAPTQRRALDDVGTPVTMLAYPGEPHGFREPAHIAHVLEAWALHYDSH